MILGLVAALAMGVTGARVEGIQLGTDGARLLVQIRVVGSPSWVSVQREGDTARVSLKDTALGGPFSGGDRFQFSAASTVASTPGAPSLDSLAIQKDFGGMSLHFRVPASVEIDVQRGPGVVTIVLHEPRASAPAPASPAPVVADRRGTQPEARSHVQQKVQPEIRAEEPGFEKHAEPAEAAEPAPTPPPPNAEPAPDLVRKLFPASAPDAASAAPIAEPPVRTAEARPASTEVLYRQLFPGAPAEPQDTPPVTRTSPAGPRALTLGPFTLHPSLQTSYIRGDATLGSPVPVPAHYGQIEPRLEVETTLGDAHLMLGYAPDFRVFASDDLLKQTTHNATAGLDFFAGTRLRVKANDDFVSGLLETQAVDPGHEYFFGLSRFRRNTVGATGSVEVAPRIGVEVGGSLTTVRFDEQDQRFSPGGFFSYDSRSALVGLTWELTPTLKAKVDYVYDRVPPPSERPIAEATAHSVQATLSGEVTPLLNGQLTVGYRDQTSPQAPESGRHYRGVVASGLVSRSLGERSWLSLTVSRATPVSSFEANAFYVSTAVGLNVALPLPLSLSLDSGVEHRWNDYRTDAIALGSPRQDRILGWRAGLRRALGSMAGLSAYYRRERRDSNLQRFDSTTDGLIVQFDLNTTAGTARR